MDKEEKLRILQLSNKSPFPPAEGGPMAMHAAIDAWISVGFKVDILTMETPKFRPDPASIPENWRVRLDFQAVEVDSRIRPSGIIFNLLSKQSYLASRFRSTSYAHALKGLLSSREYDIIQLESPMLACYLPLIRKMSRAKVVLRAHNIEHRIWERIARNHANLLLRYYLRLQSRRLGELEKRVWKEVDAVAAITDKDAADIAIFTSKEVRGIPFGIRTGTQSYDPIHPRSLAFIGSMDWMPNLEGITWFIEKVWPRIQSEDPETSLYLAGRNFPDSFRKLQHLNIFGLGEVDDSLSFICSSTLFIVPLLSGSGIRIKIIEAMSAACPVLSTSLGCEGIAARHGQEIYIADSPEAFARTAIGLLKDEKARIECGSKARSLVEERYSVQATGQLFLDLYQYLIH
jgi:polysaccharide biosynthesis protein PslH